MTRKRESKARALSAAIEAYYAKKAEKVEAEPTGKIKKPTKKQVGGFGVR